jgi:ATP/maltotriose-dependent transcriptional regulator MalT
MSGLVTTLRGQLEYADLLWQQGRHGAALSAYEGLLQRAQERTDRMTEVVARSMLALCSLRRKDLEDAQNQLQSAGRYVDPEHLESYERYRSSLCRLALDGGYGDSARQELLDYLEWAEDRLQRRWMLVYFLGDSLNRKSVSNGFNEGLSKRERVGHNVFLPKRIWNWQPVWINSAKSMKL